jgi:hypothetical protein
MHSKVIFTGKLEPLILVYYNRCSTVYLFVSNFYILKLYFETHDRAVVLTVLYDDLLHTENLCLQYCWGDRIKEDEVVGICSMH